MRTCHAIATMLSIAPAGAMAGGLGNAHNKALYGLQPLLEGGDCSTLSYAELLTRREQAKLSGKGVSTRPPLIERESARREVARLVDHAVALGIVPAHLDPSEPSLGEKQAGAAPKISPSAAYCLMAHLLCGSQMRSFVLRDILNATALPCLVDLDPHS